MLKAKRSFFLIWGAGILSLFFCVLSAPEAQADLFVGNFFSPSLNVLEYNATTGAFVKTFIPTGSGGLSFPLGGGFGPDGNFYVSNSDKDVVLRYNGTTGAFLNTFATGAEDAAGLTFHSGNLYVAFSASPGAVGGYNGTTGAPLTPFPFVSSGSGGLSNPEGLVFGPDGNLYVGSNDAPLVRRYNGATGAFLGVFASGTVGNFRGVTFGPDGNLYVTDFGAGTVLRFNGTTGAFVDTFVGAGSGGLSSLPRPLVFGPDGNLYVGDFGTGSILRYNGSTGAFMNTFVAAGSGGLGGPTFLVFDGAAPTPSVPEPATLLLLGFGLAGLSAFAGSRTRRR